MTLTSGAKAEDEGSACARVVEVQRSADGVCVNDPLAAQRPQPALAGVQGEAAVASWLRKLPIDGGREMAAASTSVQAIVPA